MSKFKHSSHLLRRALVSAAVLGAVTVGGLAIPRTTQAGGKPPPPPPPADPAIAYVGSTKTGNAIFVMNADGSNATAIQNLSSGASNGPSWSPNAGSIAFIDGFSLWRVDVSVVNGVPVGSNPTLLLERTTSPETLYVAPAWSPAGDEIVVSQHVAPGNLLVVPATGGTPEEVYVSSGSAHPDQPTWSPDGGRIAFYETDGTVRSIKVLDRGTGDVQTVHTPPTGLRILGLDWARDSDTLAFAEGEPGVGAPFVIYTLDLSSGAVTQVVENGTAPSWSPDDSRLVFNITSRRGLRLGVIELASGTLTQFSVAGQWADWRRN